MDGEDYEMPVKTLAPFKQVISDLIDNMIDPSQYPMLNEDEDSFRDRALYKLLDIAKFNYDWDWGKPMPDFDVDELWGCLD